jgi:long-subunit acyl-CoA synthetase (AMP-forming)
LADAKDKLLLDAAYEWEKNSPNRVYMTQPLGDGKVVDYTWAETMNEARRMAAHLRSLNLPDNSHIALISKNCAHFVMCDLAIWMAGHATIALYPTLNADTVEYILDHSDSRLVFIGKLDDWDDLKLGIPDSMPKIALPLAPQTDFDKWEDIIARNEPIADSPSPPGKQLALMCYTSGSTGRPKGVMHSFASASIPAQGFGRELEITADDRILSYLPLAHVMERATVECASFYTGTHIYFADNLSTFLQDMHRARPTLFISVPRLWLKFQLGVFQKFPEKKLDRLLKIPLIGGMVRKKVLAGLGLGDVRIAGSGSAPLPADLIEWYDKLGLHIIEGYGMSEDFAYSHMSTLKKRKPGYVGVAWSDVQTRVSDEGEIQLKSPGDMVGYYKAPEMTAECYTEDGFFRTGDRGVYTPEGLLKITGRTKELFKTSKGKYVAPVPIENLLNCDSNIELSCVSGSGRPACYGVVQLAEDLHAKIGDQRIRDQVAVKLEALLNEINNEVEEYEKMQFIAVAKDVWDIANDFLTPTLKIKRNVVEEAYAPYLDEWYDSGEKVIWQN